MKWYAKWWVIVLMVLVLAILVVGTYAGLYVNALSKVELREVVIEDVGAVSVQGFDLKGHLDLYNGGLVKVKIHSITYDVTLDANGEQLTEGTIVGKELPSKETTRFDIINFVDWKPTSQIALNLITPRDTYATINGVVYVSRSDYIDIRIPFTQQIDLEPYIKQFIQNKVNEVISDVGDALTDAGNVIVDGVVGVFDGIVSLFD